MLQSCLRESAISLPEEKLDQLTLALFESADKDCSGTITFDELRDELQRFPGVMENLTIRYSPVSDVGTARVGLHSRCEECPELTHDLSVPPGCPSSAQPSLAQPSPA